MFRVPQKPGPFLLSFRLAIDKKLIKPSVDCDIIVVKKDDQVSKDLKTLKMEN